MERADKMLYVLVVIHNSTCAESIACRCLHMQDDMDFRVLVYDNSDSDFGINGQCTEKGWVCLGGNGNRGLPAAYNSAIDYIKNEGADGYICILDDDTGFESSFIAEVKSAMESGVDIILPVLAQNGRIISPWRENSSKHFKSYDECAKESSGSILAFNSGMIISLDVFRDYRYDEKLFLDCVDISFLTEMKKRGKRIAVAPIFCRQSFSGMEKPPRNAVMERFEGYLKDMRTYYGDNCLKSSYFIIKRALHLSLIYATVQPLRILFSFKRGNSI